MTPDDYGRISARAIGTLLVAGGLVMFMDFTICHYLSRQLMNKQGWTYYAPNGETIDDEPTTTFVDTYFVSTPAVSPIGSGGFILSGLAFLAFSRRIGRVIAGATIKQSQGEQ